MSAASVRAVYRSLLRDSRRFADYNLRSYAQRSVRDRFRSNLSAPSADVPKLLEEAKRSAEVLQRQSAISQMYQGARTVLEA